MRESRTVSKERADFPPSSSIVTRFSVVIFENKVSKWGKAVPPVFGVSTSVSCKTILSINSSGCDAINEQEEEVGVVVVATGDSGKNGEADTERLNEPDFVLLPVTAAAVVFVSAAAAPRPSREVDDSSGDCKKSI